MLTQLIIRDLAVVESLELDFEGGLSVLTGETGAGKSILMTALGLALGDRADSGFIRPGADRAEISLRFDLSDAPMAREWLEEQALAENEECLIRRVIARDGRSRAFVNGCPVTLQSLQGLGLGLVEIHGQHAHVELLKSAEQRRLLDEAAGNATLLTETAELYRSWRDLNQEWLRRTRNADDQTARIELLTYQIEELEQHEIESLDYNALIEEHERQASAGHILEVGHTQLDTLYENETDSVTARVARSTHDLSTLLSLAPELTGSLEMLDEALTQIKEAALELRRTLGSIEVDPDRLAHLEQRIADVHRLARKHQIRPESLPQQLTAMRSELEGISSGEEDAERLREELGRVRDRYQLLAHRLSESRKSSALRLQEQISAVIRGLGMPQGELAIRVTQEEADQPALYGLDQVEFQVSANPGMPLRPLARVASGGELSRISLAIQVATTRTKSAPTLIFDEVDSGISGGIAEVVGQQLRSVGERLQVFCITHLPQVAAQGHHHWLVEKHSEEAATFSQVSLLGSEARIREVARMLGGVRITAQTLAHAEEMLGLAEMRRDG